MIRDNWLWVVGGKKKVLFFFFFFFSFYEDHACVPTSMVVADMIG